MIKMGGMGVMVKEIIEEGLFKERGKFERRRRIEKSVRNLIKNKRDIGIEKKRLVKLKILIKEFKEGGDERWKGKIGIDIREEDEELDENEIGKLEEKEKKGCEVVMDKNDIGGGEGERMKKIVGIDVRRKKIGVIGRIFDMEGKKWENKRCNGVGGFGIEEKRLIEIWNKDGIVKMDRNERNWIIIIRNEGDEIEMRIGNIINRVFNDEVEIGNLKRIEIEKVKIMMERKKLEFWILKRNERIGKMVENGEKERIINGGEVDKIKMKVRRGGLNIMKEFWKRRFIGLIENVELKIGWEIREIKEIVKEMKMFFKEGERRMGKIVMMVVK